MAAGRGFEMTIGEEIERRARAKGTGLGLEWARKQAKRDVLFEQLELAEAERPEQAVPRLVDIIRQLID